MEIDEKWNTHEYSKPRVARVIGHSEWHRGIQARLILIDEGGDIHG